MEYTTTCDRVSTRPVGQQPGDTHTFNRAHGGVDEKNTSPAGEEEPREDEREQQPVHDRKDDARRSVCGEWYPTHRRWDLNWRLRVLRHNRAVPLVGGVGIRVSC